MKNVTPKMQKINKLMSITMTLAILASSECFAAKGFAQRFLEAKDACSQNSKFLEDCNSKLAVAERIEIKQAREEHINEIARLNQKYVADLKEKAQIIDRLAEQLKVVPEKRECTKANSKDNKIRGIFLAKLAIRQSRANSEIRSANSILSGNKLFKQYLLLSFDEFKKLIADNDGDQVLMFSQEKANEFIQIASN